MPRCNTHHLPKIESPQLAEVPWGDSALHYLLWRLHGQVQGRALWLAKKHASNFGVG